MWVVIKIDKKKFGLLKNDFKKKTGEDFIFYSPRMKVSKYFKNKLISKEIDILGDYEFCFNKSFSEKKLFKILKFSKGLKYFLNGFFPFQREILSFINGCKSLENKEGLISSSLYSCKINNQYQFLSGPFVKNFFTIIGVKQDKLKILLGGIETYINRKKYIFHPAWEKFYMRTLTVVKKQFFTKCGALFNE